MAENPVVCLAWLKRETIMKTHNPLSNLITPPNTTTIAGCVNMKDNSNFKNWKYSLHAGPNTDKHKEEQTRVIFFAL